MLLRFMSLGASRHGTGGLLENCLPAPGQLLRSRSLCSRLDGPLFPGPVSFARVASDTTPGRASLKPVHPASPHPRRPDPDPGCFLRRPAGRCNTTCPTPGWSFLPRQARLPSCLHRGHTVKYYTQFWESPPFLIPAPHHSLIDKPHS